MPSELSDVSNLSNLSISSSRVADQSQPSADTNQPATPAATDETASSPGNTAGAGEGGGTSDNSNVDMKKAYLIAKELLTTEIHYVSKLHLIDQVTHFCLISIALVMTMSKSKSIQKIYFQI